MSIRVVVRRRREISLPKKLAKSHICCIAGATGLAIIVLAVTVGSTLSGVARAGDEPTSQNAFPRSRFVSNSRESLKNLRERLVALATQLLGGLVIDDPNEGDVTSQILSVASAKAGYDKAVLVREVAEFALKEFKEGTFVNDKKACETELELAKAELESAERAVEPARDHYARIKQVGTGSVADLAAEWQYETAELSAELQKKKAAFVLERARSKLKVLLDYSRQKTEKDLNSEIEKARSDELVRRASWELEQSKLKKLQSPPRNQSRLDGDRKRILALLDQAIAVEEPLGAQLDHVNPASGPNDADQRAIADRLRQLRELVDQAEREADAAALARMKWRLRRATDR